MPSTKSLALPSGMLPPIVSGDVSLEVFNRSPKHRAMNRSDYFRLQACARAVLRFLIARGRGKRMRSWWSARRIAAAIPRSGLVTAYSVHHVRRAIKQLEDAGLVRCTIVRAGERFPRGETPDVDGGGELAYEGGRVREVNMPALLGEGPVWDAPVRRLRLVTTSAAAILAEGAELAGTDVEAAAAAAQLRGLVQVAALDALEQGASSSPAAPPVAAAAPSSSPGGGRDPVRSLGRDPTCRSDPGSALQNHHDHERAALGNASPAATRTTAHAGSSRVIEAEPSRDRASPSRVAIASETPPSSSAPSSSQSFMLRPPESESDGGKEQKRDPRSTARRIAARFANVVEPPSTPPDEAQARLVALFGPTWQTTSSKTRLPYRDD
jgi:hypothetical protein